MSRLTFSEFANFLYASMSGDYRADEFCRLLFEKATDESIHKDLAKESAEIWKFRFNGTRSINALAKRIIPKLQMEKFGAFITDFDDHVIRDVVTKLKPYRPKMDEESVGLECTDLFLAIIQDAANNYRRKKSVKIPTQVSDSDIDTVQIESDLKVIINGLSKISQSQVIALRTNAIELSNKIEQQNVLLLGKINWLVDAYYYYVEELFKVIGTIRGKKFKVIATEIALKYQKTSTDESLNQDQIFDSLVDWLKGVFPDASRIACEIVIAFFVQNCEVFDELP